MNNYHIYHHPYYGYRIEKSGVSLIAFVFPGIWLLVKKTYMPATVVFVVFACVVIAQGYVEISYDTARKKSDYAYTQWVESEKNPEKTRDYLRDLVFYPTEEIKRARSWEEKRQHVIWWAIFFNFALRLVVALRGRSWVISNLKRRGYTHTSSHTAQTKDAVLSILYRDMPVSQVPSHHNDAAGVPPQ